MLYSDHYSGNTYAHILLLVLHSQTSHCAYSANPVVSSVCLHTIPFLHIQTRLPNIHLSIVQCILPVFIFQAFVQRFITDRCIFIRRHFSKLEVRSWKIHNSLIHKLIKYSVFTLIHYFAFSASSLKAIPSHPNSIKFLMFWWSVPSGFFNTSSL